MEEISHRIHDATKKGSIECVAALLKEFPQLVNDKGEDGWTPMFRACYNNRLELARFLAENGANLGQGADDFSNTPLHACCINGHKGVAQYLISKGVGVNEYDNVGGWTPLYAASFFGWPDLVRLLLAHGADPSIVCKEGKKALDVVCEAGYRGEHRRTIEALLQNRSVHAAPPPAHQGRSRSSPGNISRGLSRLALAHGSDAAATAGGADGTPPPSASAAALAGPPDFTEDRNGTRVYFPWELTHTDYVQRGLELAREALHRVFQGALAAGQVGEMPGSRCRHRKQADAYDLITAALAEENAGALEGFVTGGLAGEKKEGEGEGMMSWRERLEGIAAVGAGPHRESMSREDVEEMLTEVLALAEGVPGAKDVAEDARFLLEQFHAHADSKSLRLRLLRVRQIRNTPLVGGPSSGSGEGSGRPSSGSKVSTSASTAADASSSRSAGGGMSVSGGFSPVLGGADGEGGDGQRAGDFVSQFHFVKNHGSDLVLSDDVR